MKHRNSARSLVAAVAMAWVGTTVALAQSGAAPKAVVPLDFAHLGFRSAPTISDKGCTVTMSLDRAVFLSHLDDLKALHLLNVDELPFKIDTMPNMMSMGFLLQTAPSVTEAFYRNNKTADKCVFTQYLTAVDANGVEQPAKVFSYAFDRSLNDKTDWSTLPSDKFPRIAQEFRFDRDFQKRLKSEVYHK